MRLSSSRSGRANSSPVMYCELMSPEKKKSPPRSFPLMCSGRLSPFSGSCKETPWAASWEQSGSIGRWERRPCPAKTARRPSAAQTGTKKRRVEPDSLQSHKISDCADSVEGKIPSTMVQSFSKRTDAPSAPMTLAVAWMSCERV